MHPKGLVKLTIDGKERFLKVGTLSKAIFCEIENIKPADMAERLQNPQPFTIINFVFAGAQAYCDLEKIDADFDKKDVSQWIDEIGEDEIARRVSVAMVTYEPKNA